MGIDETTGRLRLPFIQPGQAQKELWHNEALLRLDMLVQVSVTGVGRDDPPAAPADGEAWIVGAAPTGAWAGQAGALAGWTAGGWRFAGPVEGMTAWSVADTAPVRHTGGRWNVAAAGRAVTDPAGGAVVDAEARAALLAVLEVLRTHRMIAR